MTTPTPQADSRFPSLGEFILYPAAVGFLIGFLGPVILTGANLGPLLGIFITGPGGAVLGLGLGVGSRVLRLSAPRQWRTLWGACGVIGVVALYYSLPEPEWRGAVLDAEVRECRRPAQALDRAIAFWEKSLAQRGNPGRSGWQEDLRRTAESDPGVILELHVTRRLPIFEHRKPWNRGELTTPGWQDSSGTGRFYARYAGEACANYPAGPRSLLYAYHAPGPSKGVQGQWPPTSDLPRFLDLRILLPVPEKYQRLVREASPPR